MKVRFWGVRGSIPSPGQATVRYGGNTSCIEVESDDGETIILDAGSGIHPLSWKMRNRMPLDCAIFITHTHWDHIQGLPFFVPMFVPGNRIRIHGAVDPILQRDIREILGRQMEYCYFPVREAELKAEMCYTSLREMEPVAIGSARVTGILMNHTVLNFGYRIDCDGKSLFFTGDHEPLRNIYPSGDAHHAEYEQLISRKNDAIEALIGGVDLLIADAAYTAAESAAKRGWGHGDHASCIDIARRTGARRLCLTHHEPLRSDDELDAIGRLLAGSGAPPVEIAREGLEIHL